MVTSLKFIASCPALACMALGKGQCWFHSDSKSKERERIGNASLESSSQICEETRRIEDPVQFTGRKTRPQGQLTALDLIHKGVLLKHNFFSIITPISIKDNHHTTGLQIKSSFSKLGLIIYSSVARITIDHIGSFKSALLEIFVRNLRLNFQKPLEAKKPSQGLVQSCPVTRRTDS